MSIHSLEFTTCITTILIYAPCSHKKLFIHLNVTITAEVAWHEEVAIYNERLLLCISFFFVSVSQYSVFIYLLQLGSCLFVKKITLRRYTTVTAVVIWHEKVTVPAGAHVPRNLIGAHMLTTSIVCVAFIHV